MADFYSRTVRAMCNALLERQIDPYDKSLCFIILYEAGYGEKTLNLCLDAARCMATIRTANDTRKLEELLK